MLFDEDNDDDNDDLFDDGKIERTSSLLIVTSPT